MLLHDLGQSVATATQLFLNDRYYRHAVAYF